jgi:hypothetical protein
LFVSLVLLDAVARKAKNALEDVVLVAGTLQNLCNLYSLDIYGCSSIVEYLESSNEGI